MKKIIIILAMVLAGVAMYAQEPQVLVLKDGTVIKGEVEKLPDGGARVTETSSSTLPRRSAMPERNSPKNR